MIRKFVQILFANIIITLFYIPNIEAQNDFFSCGGSFGVNRVEIKGNRAKLRSSNVDLGGALGVSAGAFVRLDLIQNKYLNIEIRYIKKGSVFEFKRPISFNQTILFNYVEIPVLLGFKSNDKNAPNQKWINSKNLLFLQNCKILKLMIFLCMLVLRFP